MIAWPVPEMSSGRKLLTAKEFVRSGVRRRSRALDVDDRLVADLVGTGRKVPAKIKALPPIQHKSK